MTELRGLMTRLRRHDWVPLLRLHFHFVGQSTITMSLAVSVAPIGRSLAAATIWVTCWWATFARNFRNTTNVTPPARTAAIQNASKTRRKFVNHLRKNALPAQNNVPIAMARPKGTRVRVDCWTLIWEWGRSPTLK